MILGSLELSRAVIGRDHNGSGIIRMVLSRPRGSQWEPRFSFNRDGIPKMSFKSYFVSGCPGALTSYNRKGSQWIRYHSHGCLQSNYVVWRPSFRLLQCCALCECCSGFARPRRARSSCCGAALWVSARWLRSPSSGSFRLLWCGVLCECYRGFSRPRRARSD